MSWTRAAAACLVLWATPALAKAKLHTLYAFCAESGCTDGREPSAGLVMDADGNLFGTTLFGGDAGNGVAFVLTPNAARTKYKYKRLYSFCAQASCADGADPEGALILDANGALYGTTMAGGAADGGVVFKLAPNPRHTKWTFSILYSFCALAGCADGRLPQASLSYAGKESGAPYDGISPLYGTASLAGAHSQGVAFKLTPGAPLWNEEVLHHFCTLADCADGASPNAALTVGDAGLLFGTTYRGGGADTGTAFKLENTSLTVLHSFCASAHCADGAFPASALHLDAQGNLLGTTFGGGAKGADCTDIGVEGCGTAFKLTQAGSLTVLHAFCAKKNCADGGYPLAGLLRGPSGDVFGATLYGGGNGLDPGAGVVYRIDGGTKTLYRFCKPDDCSDGVEPEGDLIMDTDGNLFGTNLFLGAHGDGGTVFELTP